MKKNYLLLVLYSIVGFSQCPYPIVNTQLGAIRTLCVGTDRASTTNLSINNVNTTNFVAFNVVQGFSYRFIVPDVYAVDDENINLYDFATNSYITHVTNTAGATLNWTATFSGQIKVILSQGICNQLNTTNTTLLSHVIAVGNTLDSQTTFGTNTWVGHVYDWVGGAPPGGTSPAAPAATTPFTPAEYVGNFTTATQNFVQGYGGDNVCFNVQSGGVNRTNILTDTYAVRYRMNSTLPAGCYILTIRGDDGIRVYIDNQLVFDRWVQQSPTVYSNVLVYLDGNADVIFDHYENNGQNVADISFANFDVSTNSIATPLTPVVCSGVTPSPLNATSFVYNGGAVNPTINYQWQVSTDNVTFVNIAGATNEDYTPPAITSTIDQIRYYRRVISAAANAAACTFNSNAVAITTTGTTSAVAAPSAIAGTGANCISFFANWNTVSGATSYILDVSTTNTFATFVSGYNNLIVGNVTTFQVSGLSGNVIYFYRLRAVYSCGVSNFSNTITYGTQPVTTPTTTTTANNCGQFTINWIAIPNATSYQIDISTVNNFASFIAGYNNLNVGNVISFTTNLMSNNVVYYRIRAVGPCGTSNNSSTTTVNVRTTIWNGTAWSNGNPDFTFLAVINGAYNSVTNGNFDACRVVVNNTSQLTISPNTFVTIQNELQNNGTVIVENNGSLVQINNSSVNTGNITVQRTANNVISGEDYVYWSAPVAGLNLGTLFSSSPFKYRWDTTATNANGGEGNWINHSGVMNIGSGYIVRDISNVNFVGVPNNGIVTVPVFRGNDYTGSGTQLIPRTATDDNWNLLGNPYPSAIGVNEFLTANTGIEGFVKIWSHGTPPNSVVDPFYQDFSSNYHVNDYVTVNSTGISSGSGDYKIASGQGFMVLLKPGSAGSTNVTFSNAMRSKNFGNTTFYRTANVTAPVSSRIWLDLVSPIQTNRLLVGYVQDATNGLDRMFDAFTDYSPNQNFYSLINNEPHIIQGRAVPFEVSDLVPIGFKVTNNGNYSIAIATVDGLFSNNSQTIYLEDKLLNIVHNLSTNQYSFSTEAGVHNDRFEIRYTDRALSTNEFGLLNNMVNVYASAEGIKINSTITNIKSYIVYNVLGQTLVSENNLNKNECVVKNMMKNNQALIVKTTLNNGQEVTRKVIY